MDEFSFLILAALLMILDRRGNWEAA